MGARVYWDKDVVADYGALGDGSTNDSAAFEAALADAATFTAGSPAGGTFGARLRIPAGYFILNKPLWVRSPFIKIQGAGRHQSQLYCYQNSGPSVVVQADYGSVGAAGSAIIPNTVSGGAPKALQFKSAYPRFYNFRDDPSCYHGASGFHGWNGATQFTVSMLISFQASTGGYLLGFAGRRGQYDSPQTSLAVAFATNHTASVYVNLGGVTKTIIGSIPIASDGSVHHVECSYDGTHLYLFVDGVLDASVAATGAVVSNFYEEFCLGALMYKWPDAAAVSYAPDCILHSFDLRNTATHSAGFTAPTDQCAWSYTHSIMNLNISVHSGETIAGANLVGGASWLVQRPVYGPVGSTTEVLLEDFQINTQGQGWGVMVTLCTAFHAARMKVAQSNGYSFYNYNNCFYSKYEDIRAGVLSNGTVRANFLANIQAGLMEYSNVQLDSGVNGFVSAAGSARLSNVAIAAETDFQTAFLLMDDTGSGNYELEFCVADVETGPPGIRTVLEMIGLPLSNHNGCNYSCGGAPIPSVIIEGGSYTGVAGYHTFNGTLFNSGTDTEVIRQGTTPIINTVRLNGCMQQQTVANSWSDSIPGHLIQINPAGSGSGGGSSVVPPVISQITPAPGAPLGVNDAIVLQALADNQIALVVLVAYFDRLLTDEVIWDGQAFGRNYQGARNHRSLIDGGFQFTIARDGGWPANPRIRSVAADQVGNVSP